MSRGGESAAVPPLRPEVAEAIQAIVVAAAPDTAAKAKKQLQSVRAFLVWADKTVGSIDASVINPRNVDTFVFEVHKDNSPGWKGTARWALTAVGRAVNPDGWGHKSPHLPRPSHSDPYTARQEELFLLDAHLPHTMQAGRLFLLVGTCGAGMRGHEAALAESSDLFEAADGRLAVHVRGDNARLVPIRKPYTEAARKAIRLVDERPEGFSRKFITANGRCAAPRVTTTLTAGADDTEEHFSLRRARATWLAAHLAAETPPHVIKKLAGPVGELTLTRLLETLDPLTPEEAVAKGLRA